MKGGNPADEQVRHSQHAMEEAGAVERNGEIVPRGRHGDVALVAGDRIEIVVAVGGG